MSSLLVYKQEVGMGPEVERRCDPFHEYVKLSF